MCPVCRVAPDFLSRRDRGDLLLLLLLLLVSFGRWNFYVRGDEDTHKQREQTSEESP